MSSYAPAPTEQPNRSCSTGTHDLVVEYREKHPLYVLFTSRMQALLEDLLAAREIKTHPLEARAKDVDSLAEKVCRPGKQYGKKLARLPDLSGLRIILTYLDDVPKVCALIREEFDVVEADSDDKGEWLDTNEFDYLSIHFVVTIKPERAKLAEWRRFKDLKAEIQVRTVLQHAWANVSHDLYKNKKAVPRSLRRRLNRLSGMFELADEEFKGIKDKLAVNAEESATKVKAGQYTKVEVTLKSLEQYINKTNLASDFEPYARELGWDVIPFCHDTVDEDFADLTGICELVGVYDIQKFHQLVQELKQGDRYKHLLDRMVGDWSVSPLFVIQLLVLLERGSNVSHSKLMANVNWDEFSAAEVLEAAKEINQD